MTDSRKLETERERIGTWGRVITPRLKPALRFCGREVLDIGCAGGGYVHALRQRGYTAWGCDLLPHSDWSSAADCFFQADLGSLPLATESVDTCLAFEVLEHLPSTAAALAELHRICRQNIIISVPNCFQEPVFQASGLAYHHWIDRTHHQSFTAETLRALLAEHNFTVVHLEGINPIMPETLALTAWHLPLPLARKIGQVLKRLRLTRRYCMSLLAVAEKV